MTEEPREDHWLVRSSTIRLLWRLLVAVLIVLVALQILIPVKGYFALDSWFAFGAWFGFLACVAMVLVARALGYVLKRPENYYSSGDGDA